MNKRTLAASGLALALAMGALTRPALAYFTANREARGAVTLPPFTSVIRIEEPVEDLTKHVTLTNRDPEGRPSAPVWVRAQAYTGTQYELAYELGEGWTGPDADGWFYYATPLADGESTTELDVTLGGLPEDALDESQVFVVVSYEHEPVLYNEDGTPRDPSWELRLIKEGE